MLSSYKLNLVPRRNTINPGDTLEIVVFITGYGPTTQNKLMITYPPNLVDETNPVVLETSIKKIISSATGEFIQLVAGEEYRQIFEVSTTGCFFGFNEGYFTDIPDRRPSLPENFKAIMAESYHESRPPLLFKFNTSKKTSPGDYEITMTITYSDGEEIDTHQRIVKIHIKSPIERYQYILATVGIIATLTSPAWGKRLELWMVALEHWMDDNPLASIIIIGVFALGVLLPFVDELRKP